MTLVAGRYHLLEAAPQGSSVRARDLQTAQTVRLFEVALPAAAMPEALARARRAAGIFHPSLVTLFDAQPLSDVALLLAYEWVPSQTLAHLADGQPLPIKRAATIAAEVADAVAELHARQVVHGGISSATVLMTLKGKAKLDRIADPSLNADASGEPADDLVALGALLQELVRHSASGVQGAQAVEVIAARARSGRFESAASFAAILRRL